MTAVEGAVALVTGGNRGIGQAFAEELLERGAKQVLIGVRDVNDVDAALLATGVLPVHLDVTVPDLVATAAREHPEVSLVVNNAGLHTGTRLVVTDDAGAARREMEVNYFGVLEMTRAFAPVLGAHEHSAIVNVLSIAALVPAPFMGGYSPAKAAALWLSTITRAELAPQGTQVTALIVGSVDTRMATHVSGPKIDPRDIARAGCKGLERGESVVDTDAMAVQARAFLARDPARYERALAKLLDAPSLRARA